MRPIRSVMNILCVLLFAAEVAFAAETVVEPLSFVPVVVLSYADPDSGEIFECGPGCRRFKVPEGINLDIQVRIENPDGSVSGEGLVWDLWFNQPLHPFPGVHLEDCQIGDGSQIDAECWRAAMLRVDWQSWTDLSADRVCVPSSTDSCREETVRLFMDADFDGARRPGTYHIALWLDRFRISADRDEFDNFIGPIRVTVVPRDGGDDSQHVAPPQEVGQGPVIEPSTAKPWTGVIEPGEADNGFSLGSERARGILAFEPGLPGPVEIEIEQVGDPQMVIVEVQKVSTGEVLAEARDRGRIRLNGTIRPEMLKDDRRFEVVVRSTTRPQGLRGIIRVRYPKRVRFHPVD